MNMQRFCLAPVLAMAALFLTQVHAAVGQDAGKKQVSLSVLMPQEDAVLVIEGVTPKQMKQKGLTRTFTSPPLDPKGTYTYTLKVTWEPNNYTKITRSFKVKIDPSAESSLKVDMTKEDPRWKDDIVVRFVPTPNEVVDAMCRLAKIGKEDVV